ncbi:MAG: T9SS type A sorting domain-containing protein [Bacteroidia bacterium]|nr:T9SS type A sorting domain-containing protein [Bacteroidia bacterium]
MKKKKYHSQENSLFIGILKYVYIFVLILFFIGNSYSQQVNGEILSNTGNITVVRVWGTHYERGFAYGYLCSQKIESLFEDFILPNYGSLLPIAKAIIGNENYFSIAPIYVEEANAMIDGMASAGIDTTGISYLDIFVVNFMTDLSGFYPLKNLNIQNCSSLMDWGDATAETDLNGKSVIAHHLDANETDSALVHNQVMVVHIPSEQDEQPWLLTGPAGQMVASQALNNSGLSAFLNTVNGFSAENNQAYEPVTLAIRKGLEKLDYNNDGVNNVNDIRDALLSNTNGYASGFIVCSLAPSTAGDDSLIAIVAELTPQQPYIIFRSNNYSDSIDGDNLYAANSMIKRNDAHEYCPRYLNVSNEIHNSYYGQNIGSGDNWNIMKTQSVQSSNLQFMQFIPEDRLFKISVRDEANPAYTFPPSVFDIDDLFLITGNNELNTNNNPSFSVYPNPVKNELTIDILNSDNKKQRFEISDLTGRIIYTSFVDKKTTVDMSKLTNGVYLVKLFTARSSLIKKIVR